MEQAVLPSPLGPLTLFAEGGQLAALVFGDYGSYDDTPLFREARWQLEEYFAGVRRRFFLPLAPAGTEFQLQVWRALEEIPYGTTLSYQELARRVGRPRSARAAGQALGRNPLPVLLPCHRVIASGGGLGGYAGGPDRKRLLLSLEESSRWETPPPPPLISVSLPFPD